MAGTSGILQYADWGTGSTADTAFGTVIGGEVGPGMSNPQHREGIGAQDQIVGGLIEISGNVEWLFQGTNDASLIAYALRASVTTPALTAITIEGGYSGGYGYRHTGCKVNSLTMSGGVNEAFTCNLGWSGTAFVLSSSPSPSTKQTGATFEWFGGDCTIDSNRYSLQSFQITVENGLEPYSSGDTKTTGVKRLPEGIKIGSEIVTVSLVLQTPTGNDTLADLSADTLDADIDIIILASDGTNTLTITLSDLACSTNPMSFAAPDDLVTWAMELEGKRNAAGTITLGYG